MKRLKRRVEDFEILAIMARSCVNDIESIDCGRRREVITAVVRKLDHQMLRVRNAAKRLVDPNGFDGTFDEEEE